MWGSAIQQVGPVQTDENTVRSTVPVLVDGTAEEGHAPGFNEFMTDERPLEGLANRTVITDYVPSEKYRAHSVDLNSQQHEVLVSQQVSSSGFAAENEDMGRWGHGTMSWTDSMEPWIYDGMELGETYFRAVKPNIQSTMGDYMADSTGAVIDMGDVAVAQRSAVAKSRRARQSNSYAALLGTEGA